MPYTPAIIISVVTLLLVGLTFVYTGAVTLYILRKLYRLMEHHPSEKQMKELLAYQAFLLNVPTKSIYVAVTIAVFAAAIQLFLSKQPPLQNQTAIAIVIFFLFLIHCITFAKFRVIKRLERQIIDS